MTNQLTQEELKQLANDAGAYMDYDIHRVYSLFFPDGALAKFAQLIQQRKDSTMEELKDVRLDMDSNIASYGQQRNVVRKVEVGQSLGERKYQEKSNIKSQGKFVLRLEGIDEYGPILGWNQHWTEFPVGTEFYTVPPITSQLVAQTLEKAVKLLEDEYIRHKQQFIGMGSAEVLDRLIPKIRALIDQPVDHIEESLGMVEQGEDELVEALKLAQVALENSQPNLKVIPVPYNHREALAAVRQTLANRRGGE